MGKSKLISFKPLIFILIAAWAQNGWSLIPYQAGLCIEKAGNRTDMPVIRAESRMASPK